MATDLMNNTTDFILLKDKYNGFSRPAITLSVIPKSKREKFVVTNLNVELTSTFDANIATFSVYNVYDQRNGIFKDVEINSCFELGRKILVNVGYSQNIECVFCGFISGITYIIEKNEVPHIVVECLDVRAAMMANLNNRQLEQETYGESIEEILSQSGYRKFYQMLEVDTDIAPFSGDNSLIEMTDESDYDFIVRVCKKSGYEFFVSQETVYVRKARENRDPIMSISSKDAIISLESNYNIMGLVNNVEVRSHNDRTGDVISAKVNSSASYGSGSSAARIIQRAKKVIIDPTISTNAQARNRADATLDDILWRFGAIKIKCVGIPELIPGRFVQLDGMGQSVDKRVYITKVIHRVSQRGFITNLEARLNSL